LLSNLKRKGYQIFKEIRKHNRRESKKNLRNPVFIGKLYDEFFSTEQQRK